MEANYREKGSLELAYLGDAVYELRVRRMLTARNHSKAGLLHKEALQYVSAHGQATAARAVEDLLDEEEGSVFRRGRNAHPKSVSKHNDPGEYALATGLEALFGYLEMAGREDRIETLFALCVKAIEAQSGGSASCQTV